MPSTGTTDSAQDSQPPPKQSDTAHSPRTFVRNDSSDTYPKCSAVTGRVNTVTPADIVTEASTYLTVRRFMRSGSLFIAAS